jgi:hypothetical protein
LRFSHLTNYLDHYVASARQNRLANIKGIPKENLYLPLSNYKAGSLTREIMTEVSGATLGSLGGRDRVGKMSKIEKKLH